MARDLSRESIIRLLKALDGHRYCPMHIILRGGAAGVLSANLDRTTQDIDVISCDPDFSLLEAPIKTIADTSYLSPEWLSNEAGPARRYLPADFRKRLTKINCRFRSLTAHALAKVDLYIMKLAAYRPQDIQDLIAMEEFPFSEKEKSVIIKSVNAIHGFEPKTALRMKSYLETKGYIIGSL